MDKRIEMLADDIEAAQKLAGELRDALSGIIDRVRDESKREADSTVDEANHWNNAYNHLVTARSAVSLVASCCIAGAGQVRGGGSIREHSKH